MTSVFYCCCDSISSKTCYSSQSFIAFMLFTKIVYNKSVKTAISTIYYWFVIECDKRKKNENPLRFSKLHERLRIKRWLIKASDWNDFWNSVWDIHTQCMSSQTRQVFNVSTANNHLAFSCCYHTNTQFE